MMEEANHYAQKCEACQKHGHKIHNPDQELNAHISPWPFHIWVLDIIGKIPTTTGGMNYVLLTTNFHIKWVEAQVYGSIEANEAVQFLWRNIVCYFGIPRDIVTDNET